MNNNDAVVVSLPEYARELHNPQVFIMPAIDPFSIKNAEMSKAEVKNRLEHYHIPDDLPIVAQISRFDRWKDPEGVIEAFRIASKTVKATLVLLGNIATDDPEGQEVFESLLRHKSDRIHILTVEDSALVNALQRHAAVVLQKSVREGFGLTATEAMWKGTAVVAGGGRAQASNRRRSQRFSSRVPGRTGNESAVVPEVESHITPETVGCMARILKDHKHELSFQCS